ncbi:MAG: hypothetical protein H6696_16360 [Deferribacteres bacterium]|nr:hypothetical protein [candidate division KSB1 bacterium]MCB9503506.1 hypothetical protein [Deferribacteres bacterium]
MKNEYDFSKGERGKFYNPDAKFNLPIYLEKDIEEFLRKHAQAKNVEIQVLVNEWLRNNIRSVKSIL